MAAGVPADESRRDAALLARSPLGWTAATWLSRSHEAAPPGFSGAYEALVARRAAREPLAYILGEREFYGRVFGVGAAVLVPRPETELLIDEALHCLRRIEREPDHAGVTVPEPARVLDIGTGSGCVAITLALEAPSIHLAATDTSADALQIARSNAVRLGAADRIEFQVADLAGGLDAAFDMIVSNPPYVPEPDRPSLPPEVRDHEPSGALFAGPDGLDVIRRLVPAAAAALRPGGWLAIEVGYGQAAPVVRLFADAGFTDIRPVPDLQSIDRVVRGRVSFPQIRPGGGQVSAGRAVPNPSGSVEN
jgi:release factor glutamine methyltransferase